MMTRTRYLVGASALFVTVLVSATLLLIREGHLAFGALFVALGWSLAVNGLLWGFADLLLPAQTLRWRSSYLASDVDSISQAVAASTSGVETANR